MKCMKNLHKIMPHMYGTGTIGERGQVVIPSEARRKLKIKSGDKFVFFGHAGVLHIVKVEELDAMLAKITDKFNSNISKIRKEIKTKGGK